MRSITHNMINMTAIPDELDLAGAGLVYQEMDPFSIAVRADGRRVRFFRSVEQTVASIAEIDRAEADAYHRVLHPGVSDPRRDPPRHPGRDVMARRPRPGGEHRARDARRMAPRPCATC